MVKYSGNYVTPFAILKDFVQVLQVNGQLKLDMAFDDFLIIIKKFLIALPVDEVWYREQYPDVDEAIKLGTYRNARQHFVENGYFEGRLPTPLQVDEEWYLKEYPDVTPSIEDGTHVSAYDHFMRHGYEEGRLPAEI